VDVDAVCGEAGADGLGRSGGGDDGDASVGAAAAEERGQAAERREVALRHEREQHDVIGALVVIGFGHDGGGARAV
jgi:hypothetical protein